MPSDAIASSCVTTLPHVRLEIMVFHTDDVCCGISSNNFCAQAGL